MIKQIAEELITKIEEFDNENVSEQGKNDFLIQQLEELISEEEIIIDNFKDFELVAKFNYTEDEFKENMEWFKEDIDELLTNVDTDIYNEDYLFLTDNPLKDVVKYDEIVEHYEERFNKLKEETLEHINSKG